MILDKIKNPKPILVIIIFWTLVYGAFFVYIVNTDSTATTPTSEKTISEIENSPDYDVCLKEAIKAGGEFLASQGYTKEQNTWVDSEGNYPSIKVETKEEELMTEVLFDRLEEKEN